MKTLWNLVGRAAATVATVSLTAAAATMPAPGTVNYVEGQVTLDGRTLTASSPNGALVETGQALDTGQGMAEMLLTPGVFLRLGGNSEVRMVSPGLANTRVTLVRGSAMLEAAGLFKQNDLSVVVGGATVRIDRRGLYDFNADQLAAGVNDLPCRGRQDVLSDKRDLAVGDSDILDAVDARGWADDVTVPQDEIVDGGCVHDWPPLLNRSWAGSPMPR